MERGTLLRVGAIAFVAIVVLEALFISASEKTQDPPVAPVRAEQPFPAARIELQRCQQLGEAGTRDRACLNAWAEERRRFLKPLARKDERPAVPAPGAP